MADNSSPVDTLSDDQLLSAFGGKPSAPANYDPMFEASGKKHGVDPRLLKAVSQAESSGNAGAVSPQGAIGLMQLMPDTAKGLGADPTKPDQAIDAAAQYLRQGLDKYGTPEGALMFYHGGPDHAGWGPKTQAYPGRVAQAYGQMAGSQPAPAPSTPADAVDGLSDTDLLKAFSKPAAPAPIAASAPATPQNVAAPDTANPAFSVLPARLNPNADHSAAAQEALTTGGAVNQGVIQGVEDIPRGLVKAANWAGGKLGGTDAPLPFQADTDNRLAQYENQPGFGRGRFLGNALVTAPAMAGMGAVVGPLARGAAEAVPEVAPAIDFLSGASQGGKVLGYASKGANGAIQGAATTPLLAATSDADVGDQLKTNALFGGALGAGIPAAADLARDIKGKVTGGGVNPLTAELAQKAEDLGIPVRGGQISNSPFIKNLDSVLGQTPFSGYAGKNAAQHAAFTEAVAKTIGAPEGTTAITPAVMQASKDRIGGVMNDVAARTPITVDDQFAQHIINVQDEARQVLHESEMRPIQSQIDNIMSKIGPDSTITGEVYQAITRKNSPLSRAAMSTDPNVKYYAGQVRDALDDALERSAAPGDLVALQQARLQYKNMKTIEPLVLKGAPGEISPALLNGQVNRSFGNRAYSGAGDLGDLADIGQRFLKEPPNSGSPVRIGIMRALEGGGIAGGAIGAYQNPELAAQALGAFGTAALMGRGLGAALDSKAYKNLLLRSAVNNGSGEGLLRYLANVPANQLVPASIMARNRLMSGNVVENAK